MASGSHIAAERERALDSVRASALRIAAALKVEPGLSEPTRQESRNFETRDVVRVKHLADFLSRVADKVAPPPKPPAKKGG